jgi:flagellar basal body rod protein FlgF
MVLDSYSINSTGVTAYVRNTGTKALSLTTMYIDGSPVTTTNLPQTLPVGEVVTVSGLGTGLDNGASHILKIMASDGTPLEANIHK